MKPSNLEPIGIALHQKAWTQACLKFLIGHGRIEEAETLPARMGIVRLPGDELVTLNSLLVEKRISLREEKARSLIDSGEFTQAEEYLLDKELSGGVPKIPEIYKYMNENF